MYGLCVGLTLFLYRAAAQGNICALGGRDDSTSQLDSVECYNGTWEAVAPMITARRTHAAVVYAGDICALGGWDGSTSFNSVECYNGSRWEAVAPMMNARQGLAAMVYDGDICALGGKDGSTVFNSVECYNGAAWEAIAPMTTARDYLAAVVYKGDMCAISGAGSQSVECYNGSTWEAIAPMSTARQGLAAVVYDGDMCAIGGSNGSYLQSVECYNGSTWEAIAPMSTARAYLAAVVYDDDMCAIGGHSGSIYLQSVECYNGATWEAIASMSTTRIYLAAVVYDAPTLSPTSAPTTGTPTAPTLSPTSAPTMAPTLSPLLSPTSAPTTGTSTAPTLSPTSAPTMAPTAPTLSPTSAPTTAAATGTSAVVLWMQANPLYLVMIAFIPLLIGFQLLTRCFSSSDEGPVNHFLPLALALRLFDTLTDIAVATERDGVLLVLTVVFIGLPIIVEFGLGLWLHAHMLESSKDLPRWLGQVPFAGTMTHVALVLCAFCGPQSLQLLTCNLFNHHLFRAPLTKFDDTTMIASLASLLEDIPQVALSVVFISNSQDKPSAATWLSLSVCVVSILWAIASKLSLLLMSRKMVKFGTRLSMCVVDANQIAMVGEGQLHRQDQPAADAPMPDLISEFAA